MWRTALRCGIQSGSRHGACTLGSVRSLAISAADRHNNRRRAAAAVCRASGRPGTAAVTPAPVSQLPVKQEVQGRPGRAPQQGQVVDRQPARPPMQYLLHNGHGSPCSLSSAAWLEAAPRGAYTTARTVGGSSVLELSFHIQRLASSAALMIEAAAAARPGAALSPVAAAAADPAQLRPLVLEAMRAAVRGYRSACSDAAAELKLTVLVTWPECEQQPQREPATGAGSDAAAAASGEGPQATTPTSERPELYVHVAALPPRPSPPVKVVLRGAPRQNAEAKDSEWVRQRKALWQGLPDKVEEVVLVGEGGALFEGLSSNFFAVVDGTLHTAGEGVLAGTVREVALAVARREGIPVVLRPPLAADLERWEGCLVSSTSRLLLPVDEVRVHEEEEAEEGEGAPGTQPGQPRQQRVRVFPRGGLAQRLEALVLRELEACSEPLLGASD